MDWGVDEQIERHRTKIRREFPELLQLENEMKAVVDEFEKGFWTPSPDKPMNISYFLKFLDPEPLVRVMRKYYAHHWKIEYLETAAKTIFVMILKKIKSI